MALQAVDNLIRLAGHRHDAIVPVRNVELDDALELSPTVPRKILNECDPLPVRPDMATLETGFEV